MISFSTFFSARASTGSLSAADELLVRQGGVIKRMPASNIGLISFTALVTAKLTTPIIDSGIAGSLFLKTNNGLNVVEIANQVGTTNWLKISPGGTVNVQAVGVDAQVALQFTTKGQADFWFFNSTGVCFIVHGSAVNPVNWLEVQAAGTGARPILTTTGQDADVDMEFGTRGAGGYRFKTDNAGTPRTQLEILHTVGADWIQLTGGNGSGQIITAGGSANVQMTLTTKGTAGFLFQTASGAGAQFEIAHQASGAAVNHLLARGGVSGGAAANLEATGTDANVGILFLTKGTGAAYFDTGTLGNRQFRIDHTATANRHIVVTGSNGGNPVIDVTAGALKLSGGTADIQWGKANVALGGGVAPTFGTIGGTGPAAAAQRNWLRLLESDGTASFIPVWR